MNRRVEIDNSDIEKFTVNDQIGTIVLLFVTSTILTVHLVVESLLR